MTIDGATYAVTGPFNGDGGGISGAEFTFQTPFSFVDALRNFGIYMNYAYVDTGVKEFYPVDESAAHRRVCAENGGPRTSWFNAAGWEARLGYKYHRRSASSRGWNGSDVRTLGERRPSWTSAASYQVNDSFGFVCRSNNLTNEPLRIIARQQPDRLGLVRRATGVARCSTSRSSTETEGTA